MKVISLHAVLALLAASGAAHAEMPEHHHDMAPHQMAISQQASSQHQGMGVIKAVNEKANKVQIAHEAIPSLNWPPMTMWFALSSHLLVNAKVGDTVRFELVQDGKNWVVVSITTQ